MKAIKLILTFVVILGVIVGALFIFSGNGGEKLPPMDDNTLESYRTQFENDWKQKGDWDANLFNDHVTTVKQLSVDFSVEELRRYNTQLALELVHEKVFGEWGKATCSKNVVDRYINALNTITSTDNSARSDNLATQIRQVNTTYREALTVANLSVGLRPGFNGTSWNSYDNYEKGVKQRRDNVLQNSNYKQYLSNITSIKNGLNAIDGKLSNGRSSFYNNLASSIIAHFKSKERNYENLGALRSVRDKFNNESSSTALKAFVDQFAEEVDAAE